MAVTYHEWTAQLRECARQRAARGMLGVIAAQSCIPEGRLRTWIEDDSVRPLSHTEFTVLHEVLADHLVMEGNSEDASIQTSPVQEHSCSSAGSCKECGQSSFDAFDPTD